MGTPGRGRDDADLPQRAMWSRPRSRAGPPGDYRSLRRAVRWQRCTDDRCFSLNSQLAPASTCRPHLIGAADGPDAGLPATVRRDSRGRRGGRARPTAEAICLRLTGEARPMCDRALEASACGSVVRQQNASAVQTESPARPVRTGPYRAQLRIQPLRPPGDSSKGGMGAPAAAGERCCPLLLSIVASGTPAPQMPDSPARVGAGRRGAAADRRVTGLATELPLPLDAHATKLVRKLQLVAATWQRQPYVSVQRLGVLVRGRPSGAGGGPTVHAAA
jgi:hypothetical protein